MSSTLSPRETFRQTVAAVAALAKAKLPTQVNGRIESAIKLVLSHDVEPQEDGSILVGSSSDPLKQYHLVGTSCTCQDFERSQAPDGWCQHKIAAAIQKRVQALLPQGDPLTTLEPTGQPTPPAVPPGLPGAPASVNVRLLIDGRDCQLTLRDTDEARLLQRLAAVLAQFPAPASPQGQPSRGDTPQCPTHGALKRSTKGKGWYCPQKLDDDTWCPHKAK